MTNKKDITKARFKIHSIFLFVNLTVLFLPIFGVIFFRFYENQLVKQTESELISQAAVLSAVYKDYVKNVINDDQYGKEITVSAIENPEDEYYTPISPQSDLFANDILPPRPNGIIVDVTEQNRGTMLAGSAGDDQEEEGPELVATRPEPQIIAAAPKAFDEPSGMMDEEDTITVVGSRVKGRTALDDNIPMDVIAAAELAETPSLNLKDSLGVIESPEDFTNEDLLPVVVEAQKTTLAGIKILDHEGTAIVGRNELGLNFAHLEEIKGALEGRYVSLLRERISDEPLPAIASISRGTGVRLFVAFPVVENDRLWGVIYLSRTPQNILKHIYANRENMTLIGVSLLLLTFALAWLTSNKIAKPINRLIDRIKRFTEGEVAAIEPMPSPGVKEIELLSKSFSNMAHTINNRANYIRDFAMSVSHEFKTPITSIQGSAELLLEHIDEMSEKEKNKFINNIIVDSDRLKRLITRLLELARIDSFVPENEQSSLNEILNKLCCQYAEKGLLINLPSDVDKTVLIASEHLETIFINLFDNALQHNADAIDLSIKDRYGFITIGVSDNGDGISKANREKVFTSFFTTRREEGGTGLGLDIISSLLNSHNGSIELKDHDKTTFAITLPVLVE